jgi:hypothetical protein
LQTHILTSDSLHNMEEYINSILFMIQHYSFTIDSESYLEFTKLIEDSLSLSAKWQLFLI